jgi:hypothetical protein
LARAYLFASGLVQLGGTTGIGSDDPAAGFSTGIGSATLGSGAITGIGQVLTDVMHPDDVARCGTGMEPMESGVTGIACLTIGLAALGARSVSGLGASNGRNGSGSDGGDAVCPAPPGHCANAR